MEEKQKEGTVKNYRNCEWLREQEQQGVRVKDIAKAEGVSEKTIRAWRKRCELSGRVFSSSLDLDWLKEQVEKEARSYADIGRELGISRQRVWEICRLKGIHPPDPVEKFIRDNWQRMTDKEMGNWLKKPRETVKSRRRSMGLKKDKGGTCD